MTDPIQAALEQLKQGLSSKDRMAVNQASASLIALRAPLGRQWLPVAAALLHNGEIRLAIDAARTFAEQDGTAGARFHQATILSQAGRLEEAETILSSLPDAVPDIAANQFLRGSLALNRGDSERARGHLEQCVAARPTAGQAWLALSESVDFAAEPELARRLEHAVQVPPPDLESKVTLAYALGRMRHQLGDHPGAFEAFADGAAAKAASLRARPGNPDMVARSTAWPQQLIDEVGARITVPHARVIFVTGLPRSGTTLVEQILVSHREVAAGEELGLVRILAQEIGGVDADSFRRWLDRGGDPNVLVELYLHLAAERLGEHGRFVDKTVKAGNHASLLMALFPEAPIFWLRRDSIDNGWSAFRTYFARGASWSWDLAQTGERLAQEDRMVEHWQGRSGGRLTLVDYSSLVRDPEAQVPRIAAAAGLDLDERMLRPHETERTVATASVSQVRQPINLKGIGVAEPYRPWLGPMIDAYETASARARPADEA